MILSRKMGFSTALRLMCHGSMVIWWRGVVAWRGGAGVGVGVVHVVQYIWTLQSSKLIKFFISFKL